MNKIIAGLTALLLASTVALQARTLRLVYIAHDVNTPIETLVQKVERYYEELEDEAEDENSRRQTILYLSSGSKPIVVNMSSGQRDDDQFNRLVSELYERNYHDVDTEVDVEKIVNLLSDDEFLSSSGTLDVQQLRFEFFVTPIFWEQGHNEKLIATLFYSLGLERFFDPKSPEYNREVSFKTYFPTIEDMRKCVGTEGKPFGNENVNNINNLLSAPDFIGSYR